MTFKPENLVIQGQNYDGTCKTWSYITTDSIATVKEDKYFDDNAVSVGLQIGNTINVSVVAGTVAEPTGSTGGFMALVDAIADDGATLGKAVGFA